MSDPQWSSDVNGWTVDLQNDAFERLTVIIYTDGADSPPTPRQLQALQLVSDLKPQNLTDLAQLAREYAEQVLDDEELDEMEPEDFEVDFHTAVIPKLRNSAHCYYFLAGNSDIDIEHGIGCLCRDGTDFQICNADVVYADYEWDSTVEFEALLT